MKGLKSRPLMLVAVLVPCAAYAGSGAFEINQDCVAVGCFPGDAPGYPVTISQPGTYVLTSDIAPPGNEFTDAIEIPTATPVDVDLRGHTIDGGSTCAGTPVVDCTALKGRSGFSIGGNGIAVTVHIHDGRIRGFTEAFHALDLDIGSKFDGLTVTDSQAGLKVQAVTPDYDIRISNSMFARNKLVGIGRYTGDTRVHVENCTVAGNGANGIEAGSESTFVNNRIDRNGGFGIACNFTGSSGVCAVGGNTFSGNNGGVWDISTARILGSNACMDTGTCP